MNDLAQRELDYRRIEQAIRYLNMHVKEQPDLTEVAAHVALSPYHFQRLFTRWAGVSPKRFLALLTLNYAKEILEAGSASVLEAALDCGLSGAGRLHDLFVTMEAMTPGEYKAQGHLLEIRFGFHPTPFGRALLCVTRRGVCGLSFVEPGDDAAALTYQQRRWPLSKFVPDEAETALYAGRIFSSEVVPAFDRTLACLVKGTAFQCKVWKALLEIPPGELSTYSRVAASAGKAAAVRAAANAVGLNPVAYLIPCHRVIRESGALGGYRWGVVRKQAMLAREFAERDARVLGRE
ncbi:MAG: methylated-DNA--[protein]-cysteine S-methyltransferase [Spirochaetales bacterium]|nr:methylated-DNA--[protein]-cysteine S-methyltransferase [Spirochaetales bacterium]